MTAPVPSSPGGLREELAEAARDFLSGCDEWPTGLELAAALLPIVERHAARRAAEALRAAAEELHVLRFNADANPQTRWPSGSPRVTPDSFYRGINVATLALRARASALDPTTEETR